MWNNFSVSTSEIIGPLKVHGDVKINADNYCNFWINRFKIKEYTDDNATLQSAKLTIWFQFYASTNSSALK